MQALDLLSPGAENETFSTPPTTPLGYGIDPPPYSQRNSQPSSLRIEHCHPSEWIEGVEVDRSPVEKVVLMQKVKVRRKDDEAVAISSSNTDDPSSNSVTSTTTSVSFSDSPLASPTHKSSRQKTAGKAQMALSPCFIHSHLNKASDWLRSHPGMDGELGVAKSLQRKLDPMPAPSQPLSFHDDDEKDVRYLPNGHGRTFGNTAIPDYLLGDIDSDSDSGGNLTKQLAETAVGVRELSKQLGK